MLGMLEVFGERTTEGLWDLEATLHVTTSAPLESCTNCLPLNVIGMNLEIVEMVVSADEPSLMVSSLFI